MKLSYVILTYNRRDDLLRTLGMLGRNTTLPPEQWETCVVDNASDDGTGPAVAGAFPQVRLIHRPVNEGSVARNAGVQAATGQYIILLDDDSYPQGDTVRRSIEYLERNPDTALVGGRVILPDGAEDGAAFPLIMPACALCIRRSAFQAVGGFSPEFFRQAEEYDLIFRLLRAGYRIQRFEDLVYRHEKVPRSRNHALIHQMDLKNNLILVERYLPRRLRSIYRGDWVRRYAAIARHDGHLDAAATAIAEFRAWAVQGRQQRLTLSDALVEMIFQWQSQAAAVRQWAQERQVRRVVIADFTKNLYATYRACRLADLAMLAVAEGGAAFAGMRYRGVAVLADEQAMALRPQGIVLSNVNPARIQRRLEALEMRFKVPVLRLWQAQEVPVG